MDISPDPLTTLLDDRLPAITMRATAADWTAGIALGLLAAILLGIVASLLFRPRLSAAELTLRAFENSTNLPPAERLLAQTTALRSLATALKVSDGTDWLTALGKKLGSNIFATGSAQNLSTALYRPVPEIDPDALQNELIPLIKRCRR